jgi:hypothetical protein
MTERGQSPAHEPGDEELIARLRQIAATADPVPVALTSAVKGAFALRDLDARVAALVRDSAVDAPVTAVRGGEVRMLSFEVGSAAIECEVTARADGRDVNGQVSGASPMTVYAHVAGRQPVSADVRAHGFFSVWGLPPGPLRLRCQLAGGATIVTSWTSV